MFTKTPQEITEAIMLNRMKQVHITIKAYNPPLIDKMFKSIIDNNRILLFKKVTADKAEEQEIIDNWSKILKFGTYLFNKEHIKEISWTKEGEASLC